MKNKQGFTLIELLATVALLGVLIAVAYPKVMEHVKTQEDNLISSKKELIYSATELYLGEHENDYPIRKGKIYCVPLSTLIDGEYVSIDVSDIDKTLVVKVSISEQKTYDLVKADKCNS